MTDLGDAEPSVPGKHSYQENVPARDAREIDAFEAVSSARTGPRRCGKFVHVHLQGAYSCGAFEQGCMTQTTTREDG